MKFMQTLLLAFLCSFLFSCASKVTSIKDDIDNKLNMEEGYLLIAIDTNVSIKEIHIQGEKYIKLTSEDLQKGSNYILLNLPSGDYSISRIKLNSYLRIDDFEEDIWDFTVKENMISYVGHLNIQTSRFMWMGYSNVKLENKSSIALEYLEENFSNILSSRSVQYQGPGEDDFFKVVNADKSVQGE